MKALLTGLIRLFPAAFRDAFGAELEEKIRRDWERASVRGRLASARFAWASASDLIRSALAERMNPTWPAPGTSHDDEGRMWTMMDETWRNLRHAVRTLRRSPGFTLSAAGALALAIGANTGIFSIVDAVLLDPLPYEQPGRLVRIAATAPGSDFPPEFGVSQEFVVQYAESEMLESVAAYSDFTNTLRAGDRTERVRMSAPTNSLFETLAVDPILGRLPAPDEERAAVLSHRLWTSWFGADPGIVGRTIYAGGADRTVIGVMGPDFWFPSDRVLLWIPFPLREEAITPGRFGVPVIARMAPGVELEALTAELAVQAARIPDRFGVSANYTRLLEQHRPVVRPLDEELLGEVAGALWVLLGAVALVLVIACANVVNLFLVRAERRQQDLAVRRAMGAGRGRLIGVQMAEAAVVAGLAGGAAVFLAWLTVPLVIAAAPGDISRLDRVGIGGSTLLFTAMVSLVAGLVCGLLPALRSSKPDLARLRDAGRGSTRRRHWARDGLVVAQTAMALVLLIGSGLLVRSFEKLREVDPGYDVEDVFTFQIAPEADHLVDGPSFAAFHLAFLDRVRALPGVERAGLVENVPLDEGVSNVRVLTDEMGAEVEQGPMLAVTFTGGDYFPTMGIELLRGRTFTEDLDAETGNVVLSRTAAETLWPGEDPVGRTLTIPEQEITVTVIGVVEDVLQFGFRDRPEPLLYLSLTGPTPESWVMASPGYVVKTARAETIGPEIRELVREVAPNAPMYRTYTMEGLAASSMADLSFTLLTLGIASGLALVLGAVGLYGVLSYVVAQRTQEIGVRMALGAEAGRVRAMVVRQGARVVGVGIVLGLAVALAATRVLDSLLFEIGSVDPWTFGAMALLMLAIGMLASWVPAYRASATSPVESLRGE